MRLNLGPKTPKPLNPWEPFSGRVRRFRDFFVEERSEPNPYANSRRALGFNSGLGV